MKKTMGAFCVVLLGAFIFLNAKPAEANTESVEVTFEEMTAELKETTAELKEELKNEEAKEAESEELLAYSPQQTRNCSELEVAMILKYSKQAGEKALRERMTECNSMPSSSEAEKNLVNECISGAYRLRDQMEYAILKNLKAEYNCR